MAAPVFVSIIGKDNDPLFLHVIDSNDKPTSSSSVSAEINNEAAADAEQILLKIRYESIVHAALDIVIEKCNSTIADPFLGAIYPAEDHIVYAYVTNTRIKFLIVLKDGIINDGDIKTYFKKIHNLYTEFVSSPFYTMGDQISSKKFIHALEK